MVAGCCARVALHHLTPLLGFILGFESFGFVTSSGPDNALVGDLAGAGTRPLTN